MFTSWTMGLPEQKDFKKRKSVIQRASHTNSDETGSGDEQEEAARRRRPQVNAHETIKSRFSDVNQVQAGIVNLRMEFINNVKAREAVPVEADIAIAGGVKMKIGALQQQAEEIKDDLIDTKEHEKREAKIGA